MNCAKCNKHVTGVNPALLRKGELCDECKGYPLHHPFTAVKVKEGESPPPFTQVRKQEE